MNLLLLEERDFTASDRARISGRRFLQLARVIRATPGKRLRAGILNGPVGEAEVLSLGNEAAEVRFSGAAPPPEPARLTLVIALQRPQTFGKVLHCAVTLGVKRICFIHTFKVEKSYWQSSVLRPEALRETLLEALEQCGDTMMPELTFHRRFRPFVEDELDAIAGDTVRLYGDPAPERAFPAPGTPVTLALGPEGGFNDFEIGLLRARSFRAISLGNRILRTEFALAGLLTKLICP